MKIEALARARALLEEAKADPAELERLRRRTDLALLSAELGIPISEAMADESPFLQELLAEWNGRNGSNGSRVAAR
jgi:hypothetical protein